MPLDQKITRLGASPLREPKTFTLGQARIGGQDVPSQPVTERFNLALYRDVDLEEAVRAPFVESMPSGIGFDLGDLAVGEEIDAPARYEDVVVDDIHVPADPSAVRIADTSAAAPLPPRPPLPPKDEIDTAVVETFAVKPARFVVTDSGLRPQLGGVGEGFRYASARDKVAAAKVRELRRYVVRRYEVMQ